MNKYKLGKRWFHCYLIATHCLQSTFAVQQGLRPHLLNMLPLIKFDVLVATVRLVSVEDTESVSGTLWQNSHGFDELLETAKVSACCTIIRSQNSHRGAAARSTEGASGGQRGAGQILSVWWLGTMPNIRKSEQRKYNKYNASCTIWQRQKKRGLGMHVDL